ncbi:hypothetical protein B1S06_21160 [Rhodopseudomonas palustris]|uniref:Autotransporter domain-containing protein n=1 Tax=Rhodopseudomonas palustris (strain ATCC BAA-98 / CGA009) TaxID=258594 RepID=Q6N5X4_RHOPA|nr:hypothetical protein B1S06_21160 [Rhodopseudomonas palustris]CAE28287.1 conserved hypothetical protein [Rhodopseudomonas palustris CGA009]
MAVGQAVAEPFGGLALVHLHRDGFVEGGGITALSGAGRNDDAGFSTLGSRLTTSFTLSPVWWRCPGWWHPGSTHSVPRRRSRIWRSAAPASGSVAIRCAAS